MDNSTTTLTADVHDSDPVLIDPAGPTEPPPPTEADSVANPSADTAVAGADRPPPTDQRPPRRRLLWIGSAAGMMLLALSVTLAVVFGVKLNNRDDVDAAEQQALAAAQRYAVTLTSIDANDIDNDFAAVTNGATGSFKSMYAQSADQLKPLLVQAKSVSRGHVVAAGIESGTGNEVVVMLFVDSTITNSSNPTPRVDRNRIVMTMDKVGGRWLAGKVDLP